MKKQWQAVFFDFDGVILDSVDVKTQAFAKMFKNFGPEVERAVVDYHLANGGVSRFKKFEYYYEHVLQQPISQDLLDDLGRKFNRLALKGVLASPFIDGALETLEHLKRLSIPAFVVSGTPQDEIKHIVKKKNLTPYFVEVHGSPKKKHTIVQEILPVGMYSIWKVAFLWEMPLQIMKLLKFVELVFCGLRKMLSKSSFQDEFGFQSVFAWMAFA